MIFAEISSALGLADRVEKLEVLNLFDREEKNSAWLREAGVVVSAARDEDELHSMMIADSRWHLIIATRNMQRFYQTTSEDNLGHFARWVRSSSSMCLIVPRHELIDSAALALGPYRLPESFHQFRYISEVDRVRSMKAEEPIMALSDQALFDGREWHASSTLTGTKSKTGAVVSPRDAKRPRTFLSKKNTIIKTQLGSVDYFDDLEVLREASFLKAQEGGSMPPGFIPRLLGLSVGKASVSSVREAFPGARISESLHRKSAQERAELAAETIFLARTFARAGLFHNDFRPWNIIETDKGLRLIDFCDSSDADHDVSRLPQIVALWGTLLEITGASPRRSRLTAHDDFGVNISSLFEQFCTERQVEPGMLFAQPWQKLGQEEGVSHFDRQMDAFDLLEQLIGIGSND